LRSFLLKSFAVGALCCVGDYCDAAGDEVAGRFAGGNLGQVEREIDIVGAQGEAVGEEVVTFSGFLK
jgi:hypothetical protein